MRRKIVHILPHSPGPNAYKTNPGRISQFSPEHFENFFEIPVWPYWAGYFQNDFHIKLSRQILQKTDDYETECWRPYSVLDKTYRKEIDGITQVLFPSTKFVFGKSGFGEISIQTFKAITKLVNTQEQVLIHLHGIHRKLTNFLLCNKHLNKIPLVATQRGGGISGISECRKPLTALNFALEKIIYEKIDKFIFHSKVAFDFMSGIYGHARTLHMQDGLEFNVHLPIDKREARKKLGINPHAKVLLYVGRYSRVKGVDELLTLYGELKRIDSFFKLVIVGGFEEDELYRKAIELGVMHAGRLPKEELGPFYSAADMTMYISKDKQAVDFAGISNAIIESLAYNTPVYTTQLKHFLGSEEEKRLIGKEYAGENQSQTIKNIFEILENQETYRNTRAICKKYYNLSDNSSKMMTIYRQLFKKYY